MILLVTLLLLTAVIAFVGYPLARRPTASGDVSVVPVEGQSEQLLSEREKVLAALKDLEFEHCIGNLSDRDYEVLRGTQRRRAVAILSELDHPADTASTPARGVPTGLA